jgi:hypothetical protein
VGGFVRLLTVNDRKSSWVLSVGNSSWKIQSVQANLTDGRSAEYFTYCDKEELHKEELQLADKASYAFMANNRGGVFSRNRFGRLLRLNYERPNRMKIVLVAIALAGLLLLFSRNANAQIYDLYYYRDGSQYQQYSPQYDLYSYGNPNQYPEQLCDPYYQLHVLHYQLYLPQYQSYSYAPCCFGGVVVVPRRHVRSVTLPNVITPQSPNQSAATIRHSVSKAI